MLNSSIRPALLSPAFREIIMVCSKKETKGLKRKRVRKEIEEGEEEVGNHFKRFPHIRVNILFYEYCTTRAIRPGAMAERESRASKDRGFQQITI